MSISLPTSPPAETSAADSQQANKVHLKTNPFHVTYAAMGNAPIFGHGMLMKYSEVIMQFCKRMLSTADAGYPGGGGNKVSPACTGKNRLSTLKKPTDGSFPQPPRLAPLLIRHAEPEKTSTKKRVGLLISQSKAILRLAAERNIINPKTPTTLAATFKEAVQEGDQWRSEWEKKIREDGFASGMTTALRHIRQFAALDQKGFNALPSPLVEAHHKICRLADTVIMRGGAVPKPDGTPAAKMEWKFDDFLDTEIWQSRSTPLDIEEFTALKHCIHHILGEFQKIADLPPDGENALSTAALKTREQISQEKRAEEFVADLWGLAEKKQSTKDPTDIDKAIANRIDAFLDRKD